MRILLIFILIYVYSNTSFGQSKYKSLKIKDLIEIVQSDSVNLKYTPEEKQYLSEELYKESSRKNDITAKLISIENLSSFYINKGDIDKFKSLSDEGLKLSEEVKNKTYANKFLLNIGKFNQVIGKLDVSDSIYLQSISNLNSSKSEKDYSTISTAYLYLSINQLNMTNPNIGVMKYYELQSIKYAEKINKNSSLRNKCLLNAYSKRISYLMNTGDYDNAKQLLKKTDSISASYPDLSYRIATLVQLGYLHLETEKYVEALENLKEAEEISISLNHVYALKDIYKGLYVSYKSNQESEMALEYLEKYSTLNDSILKVEKNALIGTSKSTPTQKNQKKETKKSEFLKIFIPLSIILVSFIFIFQGLRKNKAKSSISKNYVEKTEEPIIDSENAEKTVETNQPNISEIYQIATEQNDIFFNIYIETFPEFYKILLDKNLSNSDIEICALLKLNIDTKHVARIKNLTVRSIESKKYRIRKKLELKPTEDISSWLILNT